MTRPLSGESIARRINEHTPDAAIEFNATDVWVDSESIEGVCRFLRDTSDLEFSFLASVTSVDYIEYFELVYHLVSLRHNTSVVIKSRTFGRDNPRVPSVSGVWFGANVQEREIWDLMGIHFDGHPNMKRILLWEGFPGHPLRKDFLG
jgi:NADH-quinone oxidoreductase subunit C